MNEAAHTTTRSALVWLLLAASGFVAFARATDAQPGTAATKGPRLIRVEFPGGHCDLYLLAQEAVQKDLGLAARQVSKIRELVADLVEKARTLQFKEHVEELTNSQRVAVALLKAEQVQRLRQVAFQYGATASFWDPSVRRQLRVTDEQFRRMSAVPYGSGGDATEEELAGVRKTFLDYPKRTAEDWQRREWGRIAVLTPAQRAKWKEMLGDPFRGPIPSPVFIPERHQAGGVKAGEPSVEELKAEIRALRERLGQVEKRLAEIEMNRQK